MKIAFLLYPTGLVKVDEDSSFWVIHELVARGHAVSYFESGDLVASGGRIQAWLTGARTDAKKGFLPSPKNKALTPLDSMDAVFIRKEPPFNEEYLYALQLLMGLGSATFILNDPKGIALCNEKMSVLGFPDFAPESYVGNRPDAARDFVRRLGSRVVVKPLDNKAGYGIFMTDPKDKNLSSILDQATLLGKRKVMIQRYIPHDKEGDKRILLLDGEFLGAFTRVPNKSDFRANLSVGGSMRRAVLSTREKELVGQMKPFLKQNGLYFVGLDVIGGYLSEINVTSPSGIPEIRALEGLRLEKKIADFIERRS